MVRYFNEHRLFFERLFKIPNSNSYKKQLKELVINQLKENIDQKLIEDQQLDFQLFCVFSPVVLLNLLKFIFQTTLIQKKTLLNKLFLY